jgi:hypothetical protein
MYGLRFFTTLSAAQTTQCRMARWSINNELAMVSKDAGYGLIDVYCPWDAWEDLVKPWKPSAWPPVSQPWFEPSIFGVAFAAIPICSVINLKHRHSSVKNCSAILQTCTPLRLHLRIPLLSQPLILNWIFSPDSYKENWIILLRPSITDKL